MLKITRETKEVDVVLRWSEKTDSCIKGNVVIDITARGDLMHHTIEGICDVLKQLQQNYHIPETLEEKDRIRKYVDETRHLLSIVEEKFLL